MLDNSVNVNKTDPEKYHFTIEDDITYNPILSIDMDDEITELLCDFPLWLSVDVKQVIIHHA